MYFGTSGFPDVRLLARESKIVQADIMMKNTGLN
jgi:hypothetical protein